MSKILMASFIRPLFARSWIQTAHTAPGAPPATSSSTREPSNSFANKLESEVPSQGAPGTKALKGWHGHKEKVGFDSCSSQRFPSLGHAMLPFFRPGFPLIPLWLPRQYSDGRKSPTRGPKMNEAIGAEKDRAAAGVESTRA
jgi:hypothetical protein